MKNRNTRNVLAAAWITALAAHFSTVAVFAQGSLTPPGPPAPMMKTLEQIEPRTPIASLPFTISSPGAYYITANLTGVSGSDGIDILAQNVDLDLGGFTLTGVAGSGQGISVPSGPVGHITIRNGSVVNWPLYGVVATNANNGRLERLLASGNGLGGLAIGANSLVDDCSANASPGIPSNTGPSTFAGVGITVGDACRVMDCTTSSNGNIGIMAGADVVISDSTATSNAFYGIVVGNSGTVRDCSVSQNAYPLGGGGISTGIACTIIGCSANNNLNGAGTSPGIGTSGNCTIKNCTTSGNGTGISTGNGCNIIECTACNNVIGSGYGILVGSYCLVQRCLASANTYDGIYVHGSNTVVMDNVSTASFNLPDIYIDGSHNTIIRNITDTNSVVPSMSGVAVVAGSFNAIGTIDTSATLNTDKNPQANFQP
jgi:hypothetical protein